MSDHWKDQIAASEAQEREFYMWIGACIKEWANTEERLFHICAWALRAEKNLVSVVYYRTPSIDSRIALVTDLLQARLAPNGKPPGSHNPPRLKEWESIKGDLKPLLKDRNSIAHHPVGTVGEMVLQATKEVNRIFKVVKNDQHLALEMSRNEALRKSSQKASSIVANDLKDHRDMVRAINKRLHQLIGTLREEQPESPPSQRPPP